MLDRFAKLAYLPRLPRRTVRLRLTLLYGALFLVSGAALLAITYVLVRGSTGTVLFLRTTTNPELNAPATPQTLPQDRATPRPLPEGMEAEAERIEAQGRTQREHDLDQLLIQSGVALGLMSVASIGLGWVMAGRVLRPLRTMTATTRRISERNLHERLALEGPSDELTELGDTIDELLARLEAAFEAQRLFVANASHELRTPLAMMRTSLDVAAAKPGPAAPEMEALDRKLREGLDRAERLLESFLTLARAQRGVLPEQATISLSGTVSSALAEREEAMKAKGIRLRSELAEADVTGSQTLLSRLVENVIDNAIRHNQREGWVAVETRDEGEVALLTVESGGARLDPDEVRELAQPFRRLGAERTHSDDGVGIGLSIVAAIAEAHGGELALHARPGGGLRVVVELPRPANAVAVGGSA